MIDDRTARAHVERARLLAEAASSCAAELDAMLGTRGAAPPSTGDPASLGRAIGVAIRAARRAGGMTQRQLADATGIRRPNVARLERGEGLPNIATLLRVSRALEVPLGELLGEAR